MIVPALLVLAALPQGLADHLREAAVVHADFQQTRHLKALSRPLKASGSLVMARDKGVIWSVRKPLAITYVIGPGGLLVVDAQGRREKRTAKDLPVLGQMGRVFQSLVQGDWKALETHFAIEGSGGAAAWEVTLTPKAGLAGYLRRVRMKGGRFVDHVVIEEPGGDRMEIAFSRQRSQDPLAQDEAALLALE